MRQVIFVEGQAHEETHVQNRPVGHPLMSIAGIEAQPWS